MVNPTGTYCVVVIEDEAQIRRFIRTALEAEGCAVHEAETGERGLIELGTGANRCCGLP